MIGSNVVANANDAVANAEMDVNVVVVEAAEEKLMTIQAQEKALKKLRNISRYKMNMDCTKDYFDVYHQKLKNMVTECMKELAAEKRKLEIVYKAVDFFKKKMARYMAKLDETLALNTSDTIVESELWEIELAKAVEDFYVEKYTNGEYE